MLRKQGWISRLFSASCRKSHVSLHAEKFSGLYGNSRHYQFYCMNDQVKTVRDTMNQILEDHLTLLFKIASKWGRQGFSTLLSRVTSALILLDQRPFHNAHLMITSYSKKGQLNVACLTAENWIDLIESQSVSTGACADFILTLAAGTPVWFYPSKCLH